MCFVTHPECVRLEIAAGRRTVIVDIIVHPDDVGRVKGRVVDGQNTRLNLIFDLVDEIVRRHRMRLHAVDVIDEKNEATKASPSGSFQVIDRKTGTTREVAIA